jgi:hypothetical protein
MLNPTFLQNIFTNIFHENVDQYFLKKFQHFLETSFNIFLEKNFNIFYWFFLLPKVGGRRRTSWPVAHRLHAGEGPRAAHEPARGRDTPGLRASAGAAMR